MARPVHNENSSLKCGDIQGNSNEVFQIKVVNYHNADVSREHNEILQKGVPEIMSKRLVPDAPDDTNTLAVEGAADGLALFEDIEELAKDLKKNEKKKMIDMFCSSYKVEPRPTKFQKLFESMIHMGKLRLRDFIYLQCLLWKVERKDLFKKMAKKARALQSLHQNDKPPLRIAHLDEPDLQPVNGYSYVKVHLNVDILDIDSKRLRNLQVKLADILRCPQEYIAVVGVEPDESAWVTVIMPTVACEALKRHFDDGGLRNFLLSLSIDKVDFSPKAPEDTSSSEDTLSESKKTEGQSDTEVLEQEPAQQPARLETVQLRVDRSNMEKDSKGKGKKRKNSRQSSQKGGLPKKTKPAGDSLSLPPASTERLSGQDGQLSSATATDPAVPSTSQTSMDFCSQDTSSSEDTLSESTETEEQSDTEVLEQEPAQQPARQNVGAVPADSYSKIILRVVRPHSFWPYKIDLKVDTPIGMLKDEVEGVIRVTKERQLWNYEHVVLKDHQTLSEVTTHGYLEIIVTILRD